MQPTDQDPNDNWNQPNEVSSQAPYQHPQSERPLEDVASEPDTGEEQAQDAGSVTEDNVLIRWEAQEYILHNHGNRWYIIFGAVTVLLVLAAIFVFKSYTFAVLVPVMAVALFIYTRHAPETIRYTLSRKGLHINDKLYTYTQFKSFGVLKGEGVNSAVLMPRKRFQPGTTIYFPAEVGEQLVDMLASRLPMKEVTQDAIDKLLAKLHL